MTTLLVQWKRRDGSWEDRTEVGVFDEDVLDGEIEELLSEQPTRVVSRLRIVSDSGDVRYRWMPAKRIIFPASQYAEDGRRVALGVFRAPPFPFLGADGYPLRSEQPCPFCCDGDCELSATEDAWWECHCGYLEPIPEGEEA